MKRKKILFCAYDLNIGGIEKALVNLVNLLDKKTYDITIILERKRGSFLNKIDKNIKIIEYSLYESGNPIIRKIKNRLKLIKWIIRNKNKYDFSCSFATYSKIGAHLAINASKNSHLWIHSDYYNLYKDANKMKQFLNSVLIKKFKRNIYVSEESKNNIVKYYDEIKDKAVVCNNLINYEEIIKLSNEDCDYKKKNITFLNIGRHDECSKKIFRLLKATLKLKNEGYCFEVIFVGDGPNHKEYVKYVDDNKLNDFVRFFGSKENPYPYYKMVDAVVLSSCYEGFPVVFLESMVLNKPIISTKVSDWEDLDKKYGIFVNNNDEDIYLGMKQFLDKGFIILKRFDCKKYNDEIISKIEYFINN